MSPRSRYASAWLLGELVQDTRCGVSTSACWWGASGMCSVQKTGSRVTGFEVACARRSSSRASRLRARPCGIGSSSSRAQASRMRSRRERAPAPPRAPGIGGDEPRHPAQPFGPDLRSIAAFERADEDARLGFVQCGDLGELVGVRVERIGHAAPAKPAARKRSPVAGQGLLALRWTEGAAHELEWPQVPGTRRALGARACSRGGCPRSERTLPVRNASDLGEVVPPTGTRFRQGRLRARPESKASSAQGRLRAIATDRHFVSRRARALRCAPRRAARVLAKDRRP